MERAEFIEATTRLEKYFGKSYSDEQLKIMYEELQKMSIEKYKLIIQQVIRHSKYLPKVSDILDLEAEIQVKSDEEKKECSICGGTGLVAYKKIVNGSECWFGALCSCGNHKEYSHNGYYIPHIEEIGGNYD